MSVTGHRNETSLDDYVDSFSTKRSKQTSNIISSKETATSVSSVVVSSEVIPLQDNDGNPSFVRSTPTPSLAVLPAQFPVLNLTNLAQDMENSTINITLNTNLQMPAPAFESNPINRSAAKRRRVLPFFDIDSDYNFFQDYIYLITNKDNFFKVLTVVEFLLQNCLRVSSYKSQLTACGNVTFACRRGIFWVLFCVQYSLRFYVFSRPYLVKFVIVI